MAKKPTKMKNSSFSSQSSDKLIQILECLAEYRAPVRLQDIAEKLNMTQPTALRYLNSLVQQNYAYKDEDTLRYAITWKICRIGHIVTNNNSIRDIASPYLRKLAHRFDLGSNMAMHQNGELIFVDVVDRPGTILQTLQRIGKRTLMHCTASGKVLLAHMPQQQVIDIIAEKGMPKLTENTITGQQALLDELNKIRQQGFAVDNEECELGTRCVSVPLFDFTDTVAAAISVSGDNTKINSEYISEDVIPYLKETAQTVSIRLGMGESRYGGTES